MGMLKDLCIACTDVYESVFCYEHFWFSEPYSRLEGPCELEE